MGLVEIYAKFNIDRGSADVFASQAQAIVATTCKRCPDTLRCDWFFNEKQNEGIAMMVHRNDAALQQHFDAAVLLEVAKQKDTGTSRYDWFYDDANLIAVAADTYDDPASMYSHMRNFHEAHNKLLHHSTMVTEFLGAYSSGGYAQAAQAGLVNRRGECRFVP